MSKTTVVIQIGNSDNKLKQSHWSDFCNEIKGDIIDYEGQIHFAGGSPYDSPWQNACFVCEINADQVPDLIKSIKLTKTLYNQDSIAVIIGETTFV